MKYISKLLFSIAFILLFICSFLLCSNTVNVYAEESAQSSTETEVETTEEYNYIKSIDVSAIPSNIKEKEETNLSIIIKYINDYDQTKPTEKLLWYIDSTSSNGKAYINIVSYDASGNAIVSIAGVEEGSCKLVFYGSLHERGDESAVNVAYNITVKPYESIGSIIQSILTSNTVLILIISVAFTVVGKFALKIFRFGVNYKSNFASVEDNEKFKNDIRKELIANKDQTRDDVLKICLREISRETRPVKDLSSQMTEFLNKKEALDVRLKSMDEKYDEVKKAYENINQLSQRVQRLEYGEGTSDVRRSGK